MNTQPFQSSPSPDASSGWFKRHQANLWRWLRVVSTVGLMAFVIWLVYNDREKLANVDWRLIPIAALLVVISTVVKAYRWSLLVWRSGITVPFRRLFESYLIGAFFSTLLPTSVGGDAVRAVDLSNATGRTADSTSSVLIERGIGLLTVLGAGSLFALFLDRGSMPVVILLMIHGMFLGGLAGFVILRQGWFVEPILALLERVRLGKVAAKVRSLDLAVTTQLASLRLLFQMVLLSILANALTMGATYLVLVAVRDPIPPSAFVSMISLSTAAELIPISIAALGVKESAYILFLGKVEVPQAQAAVIAIIMRVLMWLLALLGGVVYLYRTTRESEPTLTDFAGSGEIS